jgi:hypothetical protein
MTVFFHIGYSRCASTYFQETFLENLNGIRVISPYKENRSFIDLLNSKVIYSSRNYTLEGGVESIKKSFPNEGDVLVSNEGLIGDAFNNQLPFTHHMDLISTCATDVKIIVLIRRQDLLAKSYYNYAIQEGYSGSYSSFVNKKDGEFLDFRSIRFNDVNISAHTLNYYNCYNYLISKFGDKSVLMLPIELIKDDFCLFSRRVCDFTGTPYLDNDGVSSDSKNEGLGPFQLTLLRVINIVYSIKICERRIFDTNLYLHKFLNSNFFPIYFSAKVLNKVFSRIAFVMLFRIIDHYKVVNNSINNEKISNDLLGVLSKDNEKLSISIDLDLSKYGYH